MLEFKYVITFKLYSTQTCATPLIAIDYINTACEYVII